MCFGNFRVDLNLWIFVGCLRFFKAGLVEGRALEARASQGFRTGFDAYACLTSDFRVMSGLTCSGSWLDCRRTRIFWWSLFSARPKFEPGEDFVQVVLCSLRLLGSVVGTRFAVCFDRDHAFSLDLCYGRVCTWIGSSTFVKLIVIIQGLVFSKLNWIDTDLINLPLFLH